MKIFYKTVARKLKEKNMKAEFSTGLYYRYNHQELGINKALLTELKNHGVELVTTSDAHRPEDVGRFIKEASDIIENM